MKQMIISALIIQAFADLEKFHAQDGDVIEVRDRGEYKSMTALAPIDCNPNAKTRKSKGDKARSRKEHRSRYKL